ncbi:MAG: NAD(P)-dependent oxidoreductase [bacterium]|nr:NAD(P)-dependent oxidoreductase [bacterium]
MKIIVFGGGGFLGSYVADALTEAGHDVVIFGRTKSEYLKPGQQMIVGDITDQKAVEKAVKGYDIVYNFAAVADIDVAKNNPIDVVKVNILGNTYALEAARKAGAKRFVYASSVYAYSRFGAFYSDSKLASEKITETYQRQYGLPFTILRYGSLYGPARSNHLSSINKFINQAIKEKKISYPGTGEEVREHIHVRDAARSSVEILKPEFENQHILITGHQTLKSRDLLMMIKEMLNHEVEIEFLNKGDLGHYQMTGYSFQPRLARKLIPNLSTDIGQGLLDLINETHQRINPEGYDEHMKHSPDY